MVPPSCFGVSPIIALKRPIWQRNTVTRSEVRAGYEVGGRRKETHEVTVNIEVGNRVFQNAQK